MYEIIIVNRVANFLIFELYNTSKRDPSRID